MFFSVHSQLLRRESKSNVDFLKRDLKNNNTVTMQPRYEHKATRNSDKTA